MTSAYSLLRAGHQVVLIDRADPDNGIASNVNAGLISPGHSLPWASPAMLRRLPAVLANRTPQLRVRSHLDPALLRWGLRFLAECGASRSSNSTVARASLGSRSREAFLRLLEDTGLDLEVRAGMLFVHSDERALVGQSTALDAVRRVGPVLNLIDRAAALAIETALRSSQVPIAGAIHHLDGMTADCSAFIRNPRTHCIGQGMAYVDASVERLMFKGDNVVGVEALEQGIITGDQYVVAAGAQTRRLVGPRYSLPIYPVRGYGLTWTGVSGEDLPKSVAWMNRA